MSAPTVDEVKAIIEIDTDIISDANITAMITVAGTYLGVVLLDKGLTTDQLHDIQMYLSAHYIGIKDKRITSEKTGDANAKYEGKTGMMLKFTRYGQMAISLDTSGTLATASEGNFASVKTIQLTKVAEENTAI